VTKLAERREPRVPSYQFAVCNSESRLSDKAIEALVRLMMAKPTETTKRIDPLLN
jgi:hypothetical protein